MLVVGAIRVTCWACNNQIQDVRVTVDVNGGRGLWISFDSCFLSFRFGNWICWKLGRWHEGSLLGETGMFKSC